jgi:hypothetical protein
MIGVGLSTLRKRSAVAKPDARLAVGIYVAVRGA